MGAEEKNEKSGKRLKILPILIFSKLFPNLFFFFFLLYLLSSLKFNISIECKIYATTVHKGVIGKESSQLCDSLSVSVTIFTALLSSPYLPVSQQGQSVISSQKHKLKKDAKYLHTKLTWILKCKSIIAKLWKFTWIITTNVNLAVGFE